MTNKGDILFYVNPSSGDIIYAVEGEDNTNFFSIDGIRKGVLAHPQELNHFDMWFTDTFSIPEVKGLVTLVKASTEAFSPKDQELSEKYTKWSKNVIAGTLSANGKNLVFCTKVHSIKEVKNIAVFFSKKGLIKSGTMLEYNSIQHPAIDLFVDQRREEEMTTAVLTTEAQELGGPTGKQQEENEELVLKFQAGFPEAGELLLQKNDKLIRGLINKWYKIYGKTIPYNVEDDSDYMDLYQESVTYMLTRLQDYTPDKGAVSTFMYNNLEGSIRNYLNPKRDKGESSEISVPHTSNEDDKSLSFDKMTDKTDHGNGESSEVVNQVLENLDPRLMAVIKGLYFEDKTLEQIGQEQGYTKEYARQLKEKALNLLRIHPEILRISDGESRNYVNAELAKMEIIFDEPSRVEFDNASLSNAGETK